MNYVVGFHTMFKEQTQQQTLMQAYELQILGTGHTANTLYCLNKKYTFLTVYCKKKKSRHTA